MRQVELVATSRIAAAPSMEPAEPGLVSSIEVDQSISDAPAQAKDSPGETHDTVTPQEARRIRSLRRSSVHRIRRWGLSPLADSAELLISELVTNAARHGGGCRELRLLRTPTGIRVEVQQTSSGSPHVCRPGPDQESGRGLLLVELLADAWGVEPDGKTSWFALIVREES